MYFRERRSLRQNTQDKIEENEDLQKVTTQVGHIDLEPPAKPGKINLCNFIISVKQSVSVIRLIIFSAVYSMQF